MISGGVSAYPPLHWCIELTCCHYYGLFGHTNTHVRSIPVGTLWVIWSGKWRLFLIHPVRSIFGVKKFSSCIHEYYWRLLPWIFIILFCIRWSIYLQFLQQHRVVVPRLKDTSQCSHLYWGVYHKYANECPDTAASDWWLHCCFCCFYFILIFHNCTSDQRDSLVTMAIVFSWQTWGDLDPLWYK